MTFTPKLACISLLALMFHAFSPLLEAQIPEYATEYFSGFSEGETFLKIPHKEDSLFGIAPAPEKASVTELGENGEFETQIMVWPNPVQDRMMILAPMSTEITVRDAQGRVRATWTLLGSKEIDFTAFEAGIYFLQCEMANGASQHLKIMCVR